MIWTAAFLFVLLMVAVQRADYLDVQKGLRDGNDGYGSNRGWHWPWTPIIQVCFFGMIFCLIYGGAPKAADLPVPDCWPWWQCNGTKATNHPNCKCWNSK